MADSPFVDDPGPGFDPDAAAAGAQQVRAEQDAQARAEGVEAFGIPDVEEEKVRGFLFNAGDGLHAMVGVGEYDWVMTQRDLDRISPPLTRIINRYDTLKLAAGHSDEAAVAIGFGLWGWRSTLERVAVLRAQEHAQGPEPEARPRPYVPPQEPPPGPPREPPAPPPPAPEPRSPAGVGGDHFPGAGAPREPAPPEQYEVVAGYTTMAERIRAARERRPNAVPREAPPAPQ